MIPGFPRVASLAARALRVWLVIAILLRVTGIRDAAPGLSLIFYATPWPAIAVGLFVLAIYQRWRGSRHRARRYLVLTAGAIFTWFALSWYSHEVNPETADLRLVQWNVARPEARLPRIASWLLAGEPDVICLSEAEPRRSRTIDRWRAAFPGFAVQASRGDMLLFVRGEILESTSGDLGPDSYCASHRIRVRGREYRLLQVDVVAMPRRWRGKAFEKLTRAASEHGGEALIVVGDFNTPRESRFLDEWRRTGWRHSFETCGNGLAETWPTFAPLLSLDQIWSAPTVRPLRCIQGGSWLSDHRPVVADLAIATPAPSPR